MLYLITPHAIVHLGHLVETEGTYDEEGNELTAPVLSSTYHIDVLWDGEPVESWDSAMVWCAPMGVHTFGSSSAIREWTEKCKELHPEPFPRARVRRVYRLVSNEIIDCLIKEL